MRPHRHLLAGVAGALCTLAIGAAPALAGDAYEVALPGAPLTETQAQAELDEAIAALQGTTPGLDPTVELRDLSFALPALTGAERRRAKGLLSRPPASDSSQEILGAEWSKPESPFSPLCSAHFCVHWTDQGLDAPPPADGDTDDIPDYVELASQSAELSFDVEVGQLKWPAPLSDGSKGGDSRTDVYLSDLCGFGEICVYGFINSDDSSSSCRGAPFRCSSYMVVENDYQGFGYADLGIPLAATVAHEYNHILQYSIDVLQDPWMMESTATWSEEKVFPDNDDWVNYMSRWGKSAKQPLTSYRAGKGTKIYGTAIWNHWLDSSKQGFGAAVIRKAWASSRKTKPKHFAVAAYDRAIRKAGGKGFERVFAAFTAATPEWQTGSTNLPDAADLNLVKRRGTIGPGGRDKAVLNHTGFRLLKVEPRSAGSLRLTVRAPKGVATGIALVGREGGTLAGDVVRRTKFRGAGGRLSVKLTGVQKFSRVTAVITNADGETTGWRGLDWRYPADGSVFRASLRRG